MLSHLATQRPMARGGFAFLTIEVFWEILNVRRWHCVLPTPAIQLGRKQTFCCFFLSFSFSVSNQALESCLEIKQLKLEKWISKKETTVVFKPSQRSVWKKCDRVFFRPGAWSQTPKSIWNRHSVPWKSQVLLFFFLLFSFLFSTLCFELTVTHED